MFFRRLLVAGFLRSSPQLWQAYTVVMRNGRRVEFKHVHSYEIFDLRNSAGNSGHDSVGRHRHRHDGTRTTNRRVLLANANAPAPKQASAPQTRRASNAIDNES